MTKIYIQVGEFPNDEWKQIQYTNDFGKLFTIYDWHFVGMSKYGYFVLEREGQLHLIKLEDN